jgi:outer membrane receptor protein involved in Fe transport
MARSYDTNPAPGALRVEVLADSSGVWTGNGLRFDNLDEAKAYGLDLSLRWTLVRDWRVIDTDGTIHFDTNGRD